MIASDLHGCQAATSTLLEHYQQGGFDYLILLGDLLNHGPRNPVPTHYAPARVAELLNVHAAHIIAVRGNCDSEVDQALLSFPLEAGYNSLLLNNRRWFLSHGHHYHPDALPPLANGDLFCFGHIHTPMIEQRDNLWLFNPGSTTFPRNNARASFGVYTAGELSVRCLEDGSTLLSERI